MNARRASAHARWRANCQRSKALFAGWPNVTGLSPPPFWPRAARSFRKNCPAPWLWMPPAPCWTGLNYKPRHLGWRRAIWRLSRCFMAAGCAYPRRFRCAGPMCPWAICCASWARAAKSAWCRFCLPPNRPWPNICACCHTRWRPMAPCFLACGGGRWARAPYKKWSNRRACSWACPPRPRPMPCATALPPICWMQAAICAPFRNCWGMPRSPQRRPIQPWTPPACCRSTRPPTPGHARRFLKGRSFCRSSSKRYWCICSPRRVPFLPCWRCWPPSRKNGA